MPKWSHTQIVGGQLGSLTEAGTHCGLNISLIVLVFNSCLSKMINHYIMNLQSQVNSQNHVQYIKCKGIQSCSLLASTLQRKKKKLLI